ncbi:unnamed protein product [Dicrocoelium dendriticum]|nr:unnamed protein product [Dicrocoelium dendriticum]
MWYLWWNYPAVYEVSVLSFSPLGLLRPTYAPDTEDLGTLGRTHTIPTLGRTASPFEYRCHISTIHYLKMFVLSAILLPLRLIATALSFMIALGLSNIIIFGCDFSLLKPHNDFKRRLILPMLVFISRLVYFVGGIQWVEVKGVRAKRSEAPILVLGPHSSFLDSLAVVIMGMPSCVALQSHANSFIGGIIKVLQPILVRREDQYSRRKTAEAICYRANSTDAWPQLLIFPEGTCGNRSCLLSFKLGAFRPGVPVQPVLLRWPNTVDSVTWVWEGPSVWRLLWMTFTQFNTRFQVEYLSVYNPNEEERLDPVLYANNVRRVMAGALGVPTCDLVYEDFCCLRAAIECRLPEPEALVYLHAILRYVFSFQRLCQLHLVDTRPHSDLVHLRLESLLTLARSNAILPSSEFISVLFPNIHLDAREDLLLNRAIHYYRSKKTTSNGVAFRRFITRACMLLHPSDPFKALRYAAKAFPPVGSKHSSVCFHMDGSAAPFPEHWLINPESTRELLSTLFDFPSVDALEEIVRASTVELMTSSKCIHDVAVCTSRLYISLLELAPSQLLSYVEYEKTLLRIFGHRGRRILEQPDKNHS